MFSHNIWSMEEDYISWPLEKKIGQLLMAHFNGEMLNDESRNLLEKAHIGSIIFYDWANDFKSPEQVLECTTSLQNHARNCALPPLLIAIDQEGGHVTRLWNGFTSFPSPFSLGIIQNDSLTQKYFHALGNELLSCGINLNLSPVVDIHSNPNNPVICMRSFSSDPHIVTASAAIALMTYHNLGLIGCLKHFPGHGDVSIDSHLSLPIITKRLHDLESLELYPFRLLATQAEMIMTAHLLIPSIDPILPMSLSPQCLKTLLRDHLGFRGVIITDSLMMDGLLSTIPSIKKVCRLALKNGSDILLLGGKQLVGKNKGFELSVQDVIDIHQDLTQAVTSGFISIDQINASLKRILQLKAKYLLSKKQETKATDLSLVGSYAHQALAGSIAAKALKTEKSNSLTCFDLNKPTVIIAPLIAKRLLESSCLMKVFTELKVHYIAESNVSGEEKIKILQSLQCSPQCIWISWNQVAALNLNSFYEHYIQNTFHIAIALNNPEDAKLFIKPLISFTTYGASTASLDAVGDYLAPSL